MSMTVEALRTSNSMPLARPRRCWITASNSFVPACPARRKRSPPMREIAAQARAPRPRSTCCASPPPETRGTWLPWSTLASTIRPRWLTSRSSRACNTARASRRWLAVQRDGPCFGRLDGVFVLRAVCVPRGKTHRRQHAPSHVRPEDRELTLERLDPLISVVRHDALCAQVTSPPLAPGDSYRTVRLTP